MQPLAHPLNSVDKFLPISRSSQWPMRSTCTHRVTRVQYTDLTLSVFMPSQVHRMGAAMEWPWRTRCWPPGICGMMHNICTNPWYNYKSFSYFGYNLVMTNVTPRDWDLRDCSTLSCISSLILMRSNSSRFPTYTVVAPASNNIVSIHLWHIETGTKHWLNQGWPSTQPGTCTQPRSHCSHSRAPGEQWARLCVFTLHGCVQAARLCRGSPVSTWPC